MIILLVFLAFVLGVLIGGTAIWKMVGWRIPRLEQQYLDARATSLELLSKDATEERQERKLKLDRDDWKRRANQAEDQIEELEKKLKGIPPTPAPKCGCSHAQSFHAEGRKSCTFALRYDEYDNPIRCECKKYIP